MRPPKNPYIARRTLNTIAPRDYVPTRVYARKDVSEDQRYLQWVKLAAAFLTGFTLGVLLVTTAVQQNLI